MFCLLRIPICRNCPRFYGVPVVLHLSRTTRKVRRPASCHACEHCAQRFWRASWRECGPGLQERKNSKQFLESESGSIISITTMGTTTTMGTKPKLGFKSGREHAVFKWRCGAISGTLCRVIHGAASSLADLWCKRVHAPVSGPTSRPTALQLPVDKCHPSAWLQLRLLRGLQVEPAPVTQSPAHCAVATLFLLRGSYCTRLTARV